MRRKLKLCLPIIWLVLIIPVIQCKISNNGNTTLNKIMLKSDISKSHHLNEGQDVNIICPFTNLIWYHNEQYFNTNRTLKIKSITPKEAGTYSCITQIPSTQLHNLKWSNITLIVCGKLTKDISCENNNQKIPSPTSGQEVSREIDTAPRKTKILTSRGRCRFDRNRSLPVIRKESSFINQTVFENDNVNFHCDVISELESHFIWLKHYNKLNLTNYHFDIAQNPNAMKLCSNSDESHTLRLSGVHSEDQGWYTCIASNSGGETISSTYLKILHRTNIVPTKAAITDSPFKALNLVQSDNNDSKIEKKPPEFINGDKLLAHFYIPPGSFFKLFCPTTGYPLPDITWNRNDTKIVPYVGKVTYEKWSMQLDEAVSQDSGIYKCTICNNLGCVQHSTDVIISNRSSYHYISDKFSQSNALLHYSRHGPIISDKFPQNKTVPINTSTYFECRVVSTGQPYTIVWLKYTKKNESIENLEKEVPKNLTNRSTSIKDIVILESDPEKPNILSFTKVNHKDEGWYTCAAGNILGQSVASAYLRVVDKLSQNDDWEFDQLNLTSIAIIVVLAQFLLGSVILVYCHRTPKRGKPLEPRMEIVYQWTKKITIYKPPPAEDGSCDLQIPVVKIEKQRTALTYTSSSNADSGFDEYEIPIDFDWEIPRAQLSLGATLGEGAFGRVVVAQVNGLTRVSSNATASCVAAVKMVKEEYTDADMADLVREMEVMKIIGSHINIINLLGCCSQNGPLWVIVEFALHGNLKDFLKKYRPSSDWDNCGLKRNSLYFNENPYVTEKHLTSFAFQIARGMEYLASRRCIHRDLAARNVLVSDNYIMKIADFGLARDIQDADYYRKTTTGLLPVKWMAPESLKEQFYDTKSDVWSYGVLLWEIMTYGEQPYPNIRMSIVELYSFLKTGQRMEKPPSCSQNIYMLMCQCWNFDSNTRPTFTEIVKNLGEMLQLMAEDLDSYTPMLEPNDEYLDLSNDYKTHTHPLSIPTPVINKLELSSYSSKSLTQVDL